MLHLNNLYLHKFVIHCKAVQHRLHDYNDYKNDDSKYTRIQQEMNASVKQGGLARGGTSHHTSLRSPHELSTSSAASRTLARAVLALFLLFLAPFDNFCLPSASAAFLPFLSVHLAGIPSIDPYSRSSCRGAMEPVAGRADAVRSACARVIG